MATRATLALLLATFLFLTLFSSPCHAADEPQASPSECDTTKRGECYNKPQALRLKLIAIPTILVASMIGVCLPLFSRAVPMLQPDRNLFVLVKAFASGVILATGYMHVLPDSFDNLTSPCLPEYPWAQFSFTAFVAMVSAVFTLMMDSLLTTFYNKRKKSGGNAVVVDHESPMSEVVPAAHGHGHFGAHTVTDGKEGDEVALRRNRIIVQRVDDHLQASGKNVVVIRPVLRPILLVLEMGIVVHSVVIGLSMGASQNPCTIRPLVAALCFHQLFEGMGLGGCILQAEYGMKMKAILVFFFSTTTPFGIALGLAMSNVYSDNSPTALIVVGLLNASSAGLLNYMALVDLLATDFMGPKLQGSVKLQLLAYVAVLLGAGGMSLMAKWA